MNIEQKENILTLTKTFKAPKKLVFSMFQSPNIEKWWGPSTWPVKESEMDFKPGGAWHYCMAGPDGAESWGKAIYEEIDEPNKIVFRDYFSDAEGNINESLPSGVMTLLFNEENGETTLTTHAEYESPEAVQKLVDMGMVEGVKETWTQLEKLLAEEQR
jgi:uncharacterized protein YndB with AHSA1/START domain